ncbi:MAG: hypothetical protein R3C62_15060 [Chloroflexota bacterium]
MMEELLKVILGGGDAPAQQSGQDPLADLIGAVLGGGAAQPAPEPQPLPSSSDPLSELIKGVLGGEPGAEQSSSGSTIIDILGSILGGGRPGGQNNSFLQPIAEALADKLGISPQVALIVINLAITLLLSRRKEQAAEAAPSDSARRGGTSGQQDGFDLDDLLDKNYLQATGATTQLARQTGMSEDQATESLQEALLLLNRQTQSATGRRAARQKSGLDHLLDSWED